MVQDEIIIKINELRTAAFSEFLAGVFFFGSTFYLLFLDYIIISYHLYHVLEVV